VGGYKGDDMKIRSSQTARECEKDMLAQTRIQLFAHVYICRKYFAANSS